jgi:RHS repeat-associated protein
LNHLANTLITISDNKIGVDAGTDNTADFYQARVLSASDYYAFGMAMKERSWQSEGYRYGFNGKENDDDFQDYGMRVYCPECGVFLSVDPIASQYPELSPYQFASRSPISGVDLDGLEHCYYGIQFYKNGGYGLTQIGVKHTRDIPTIIPGVTVPQPLPRLNILSAYGGSWVFPNQESMFRAVHYIQEKHGGEWDSEKLPHGAVMSYGDFQQRVENLESFAGNLGAVLGGFAFSGLEKQNLIKVKYRGKQPTGDRYGKIESKIEDGKIMINNNGNWEVANPTTEKGKPKHIDFVITRDGKLVIGDGHYNLSDEAEYVLGAGRIKIVDGKIINITNNTGHYRPNVGELHNQAGLLDNMGVTAPNRKISPIKPTN